MLYDCDRCGRTCLSEAGFMKAKDRGKTPLCRDCQAPRLLRVQYADDYCVPHQGLYDVDDYPITDRLKRIFGDESTCGYRDCVRGAHHLEPALVRFVQPRHYVPKKVYKIKSGQAA